MAKYETKREVLQAVHSHFSKLGVWMGYDPKRSACVYYDDDTKAQCAIGCLFDNEHIEALRYAHDGTIFNGDVTDLAKAHPKVFDSLFGAEITTGFLAAIQAAHDQWAMDRAAQEKYALGTDPEMPHMRQIYWFQKEIERMGQVLGFDITLPL